MTARPQSGRDERPGKAHSGGGSLLALFLRGLQIDVYSQIGFVMLIGLAATLGHYLFTAAFRVAPASVLAPVNYLHIFFAAIVGWIVFSHVPGPVSMAGMALIVVAGFTSALITNRKKPAVVEVGEA